ncbi:arginine N-succinyltransferase [Poriferisphaera sp. WC338]|uniref:arginine N-succinyltransferase n=1 Tax=Poriferisphaera sp. WC338 TaxID=3425129 RepID=UPI003D81907F
MYRLRSAHPNDLVDLVELAHSAGFGFTSMLPQEKHIQKRIQSSLSGDAPLFVLEDTTNHKVVGTSGIKRSVGGEHPYYSYRIETVTRHSEHLGIDNNIQTLHLTTQYNGPTEIGTLLLHPDHRHPHLGRLLSLARFLYIAQSPDQFSTNIIAEMRGLNDEQGNSPFWNALGKHFFKIDFVAADQQCALDKQFIADLLPIFPIYIPILPPEAQAVIGRVHPDAKPAQQLLISEGFRFINLIDIFDAGPTMQCPTNQIRTLTESLTVSIAEISPVKQGQIIGNIPPEQLLRDKPITLSILSSFKENFSACLANIILASQPNTIIIPPEAANALDVSLGDTLRIAPLRPPQSNQLFDI